jgi:hypothetical protein
VGGGRSSPSYRSGRSGPARLAPQVAESLIDVLDEARTPGL